MTIKTMIGEIEAEMKGIRRIDGGTVELLLESSKYGRLPIRLTQDEADRLALGLEQYRGKRVANESAGRPTHAAQAGDPSW